MIIRWTVILAMAVAAWGCNSQPYVTPARQELGLVVVLSGIEGRSVLTDDIARGLNHGGVDYAIEVYPWTSGWAGPLYNLQAQERNRRQAEKLAARIEEYQLDHPGRPVFLVGHSGGSAIAIWTAESLSPDTQIEGIVLIAPALSPTYPLDSALTHSRRGIVNFYSEFDMLVGVGTALAGTMDGRRTASAGAVGFKRGTAEDEGGGYERLFQIAWRKEMALTGNIGGHLSSSATDFVSTYVAPVVAAPDWTEALMDDLVRRRLPKRLASESRPAEELPAP
ncbi:MAG: alpha/beta hydrolase [Planctomycetaceae bacterium]|nr:alpha/beta hydrolase [Planctomycetaceae bacterium]